MLLFLVAGFAHALTLEAVDDSFGVPFGKPLQIEAFGVLENDILDGQSAGENGATAELLSGVSSGTLSCPTDTTVVLCADGSFDYTPGINFSGTDSFTYQAVFNGVISAPATVTLTACTGGPDVFSCWQESSYLAMLAELGYGTFVEGFEGAAWDSVRSTFDTTNSAPSITSQGITWTTNHQGTNEISTATGPARTGIYGGYDPNHGHATGTFAECDVDTPPASCLFHDGLSGKILTGGNELHGVGGYITGLTTGTRIAIILDGTTQINVGTLPDLGHHFFGLIDAKPAGFTGFEFRELDGKIGQERYIWGDDFIIAASGILTAPVANAGVDQTVLVGSTVTLDGSGSTDADSDPLTYSWIFSTMPADSTATLDMADPLHPTFVADVSGNYEVQLIVNDGLLDSLPDTVSISTSNSAPVANAGLDQSAPVASTVTLDGSGSTDADGDALSYLWSLTAPAGSTAVLSNTTAVKPTFVVDLPGTYVAQLIVNDGLLDSAADTVSISTENSAPVANAGLDQSAPVASTVTLDGSGSTDADGDALSYLWSLTAPAGSTAVLSNTTAVKPTFVVDLPGTYVAQLIVNDGLLDSAADTVSISTENSAPVANAGLDQSAPVASTVTLDGSGSTDADGDALSYLWSLTAPAGSTAVLSNTTAVKPTFVVDLPGTYVAQLIVNDGLLDSAADTVSISTENSAPVANAGLDQSAPVASTVTLDGSGSTDADGDALSYLWSLTAPAGSTAVLSNTTAVKPTFVVDLPGTYVAQLIVNDGLLDSAADTVSISTENSAPVANAGLDQSAPVASTVTLDGSGSTDADGDALSYLWSLTAPAGSTAVLSNTTAVKPTFVVDLPGTYVAQLIVNDGLLDSAADTVSISTENSAPVANAGLDQSAPVASTVTLDGSGSTDADGDALSYLWSLTAPAGSTAVLSNTTAVKPTFVVDLPGTYVAQLIVNDGLLDSAADTVSISTENSAPVANAGLDQSAPVASTVTLDGSGSTDADGDALSYLWSLTAPAGSTAVLSNTTAVKPTFVVDLPGTYVAQLIVNDGLLDSAADTVSISTENSAPVANAGLDQSAPVASTVTLDGSGSTDADGDALSYLWSLTAPAGSTAVLSNTTAVKPTFVVDLPGTYVAQLIVNDGLLDSLPDTVSISTSNSAPVANAGVDQTDLVGSTVTLDGSGSTDADGDVLSYSWSFTSVPAGSTAALDTTDPVHPTFVIDLPGTYVAQLIVNDGLLDSAADTVSISTTNSAPVANAGVDQTDLVGSTVTLDGSGSTDADGDVLNYSWSFTSVPAGSTAALDTTDPVHPTFVIDLPGTYVAQLIVNDGLLDSAADTVSISTENSAPVANAGLDQSAPVASTVTLDGSGSTDADGDALNYSWSLKSQPAGSTVTLSDPTVVKPIFVADVVGVYEVQLVVNDGLLDSLPDTVTITTSDTVPVTNGLPVVLLLYILEKGQQKKNGGG